MNHCKSIEFIKNIHTADELEIREFLNENYKELDSISSLGTFIDDIQVTKKTGIKAKLEYLIIERKEDKDIEPKEQPGNKLEEIKRPADPFDLMYDLPKDKIGKKSETKTKILSVKTWTCQPRKTCPQCHGSRKCKKCDGTGWVKCSYCHGNGYIPGSKGTKPFNFPCNNCHATGKIKCYPCDGTGICSNCDRNGTVKCKKCNGTGFYQKCSWYKNTFRAVNKPYYYPYNQGISIATGNKVIFIDDIIEYRNKNESVFDQKNEVKELLKNCEANESNLVDDLEKIAGLNENQKIGRIHASIEIIRISIISYTFENNKYLLKVYGENNIVCKQSFPKRHFYKRNWFIRVLRSFNKRKRKIAFLYIAAFIFQTDNFKEITELKLLDLFLKDFNLAMRNELINELNQKLSFENISKRIKYLRGDSRALIFAWQCVNHTQNHETVNIESKEKAFAQLVGFYRTDNNALLKIKAKSDKFATLSNEIMLKEYLK